MRPGARRLRGHALGGGPLLARDRYRALGHAWADGYLVSRYGSIVRRHNNLAARSIIGWNLRATIWQRRLGLVTLVATTAAGRQRYPVPDVERAEAVRFARAGVPGLHRAVPRDERDRCPCSRSAARTSASAIVDTATWELVAPSTRLQLGFGRAGRRDHRRPFVAAADAVGAPPGAVWGVAMPDPFDYAPASRCSRASASSSRSTASTSAPR